LQIVAEKETRSGINVSLRAQTGKRQR